MKLKHTQKKSANRGIKFTGFANPRGWHPWSIEKHFSPKKNSKTSRSKAREAKQLADG